MHEKAEWNRVKIQPQYLCLSLVTSSLDSTSPKITGFHGFSMKSYRFFRMSGKHTHIHPEKKYSPPTWEVNQGDEQSKEKSVFSKKLPLVAKLRSQTLKV